MKRSKLIKSVYRLLPTTRKSHPISKLLRPVFEGKRIKSFLGAQLAGFAMLVSVVNYPVNQDVSFSGEKVEETYFNGASEQVIETESTFQFPLRDYYNVSQGYGNYHPAWDIRAPKGADIYPISDGTVIEKEIGSYGYGHYVVVAHENGFSTLYAHMAEIYVNQGDKVSKETVIGQVGLTGWTTGYHLHFESMQDGGYVNPSILLR